MVRKERWRACVRRGAVGVEWILKMFRGVCLAVALCLCVLFVVRGVAFSYASTASDASSAIAEAELRIQVCYSAAADAEKAGANVTGLLSVLDGAGLLLSKASLAFQGGDYDSAYSLAVQSNSTLARFEAQAGSLKNTAVQDGRMDFWVNIVGSTVGTFAVIIIGVLLWFYLKRRPEKSRNVVS